MRSNNRCPGCGRVHKKAHDNRVGTDKAYSTECVKYKTNTDKTKNKSKKQPL